MSLLHKKIKLNTIWLVTLCIIASSFCFWDSAPMQARADGSNLHVIWNNVIQMKSEVINITYNKISEANKDKYGPDWQNRLITVEVSYDFVNTSDQTQEISMWFPQVVWYSCNSEKERQGFLYFKTLENNKEIPTEFIHCSKSISEQANWYKFSVKFKPNETKTIINKYAVYPTAHAEFGYIIETWSPRKDKIEKIDVIIDIKSQDSLNNISIRPKNRIISRVGQKTYLSYKNINPKHQDNIFINFWNGRSYNKWPHFTNCYDNPYSYKEDQPDKINQTYYNFHCTTDNNPETAFVEGYDWDWIWKTIKRNKQLITHKIYDKIKIFNWLGKNKDIWQKNNKYKEIELTIYSNDYSWIRKEKIKLEDIFLYQTITLKKPFVCQSHYIWQYNCDMRFDFKNISVYHWSKYTDTAISELQFIGSELYTWNNKPINFTHNEDKNEENYRNINSYISKYKTFSEKSLNDLVLLDSINRSNCPSLSKYNNIDKIIKIIINKTNILTTENKNSIISKLLNKTDDCLEKYIYQQIYIKL